jgi:hypothetical protein
VRGRARGGRTRGRSPRVALTALALIAGMSAALATHELAHLFDLLRGDG